VDSWTLKSRAGGRDYSSGTRRMRNESGSRHFFGKE